jgi:hypothetical protein
MYQELLNTGYESKNLFSPVIFDSEKYETYFQEFNRRKEIIFNGKNICCFQYIDFSSVFTSFPTISTETFCIPEERDTESDFIKLISDAIDRIKERRKTFEEIDKKRFIDQITQVLQTLPSSTILSFSEDALYSLVERLMAVELLSEITSDFSDEQMKEFKKSIKRRKFFR